jgi:hypothetical protein
MPYSVFDVCGLCQTLLARCTKCAGRDADAKSPYSIASAFSAFNLREAAVQWTVGSIALRWPRSAMRFGGLCCRVAEP